MRANQVFYFLIIISSIFGCSNEPRIEEATLLEINNILEESIENRNKDILEKEREIIKDIHRPVKMKYAFLNESAGKVIIEYEKFYNKKDSIILELGLTTNLKKRKSALANIKENLNQTDSIVLAMFNNDLKNQFQIIGLKEHELKPMLDSQKEYLINMEEKFSLIISEKIENNLVFKYKHLLIQFVASQKERHFINSFRALTGSRLHQNNSIIPIFFTPNQCIKKGDEVEFEIGLGTFYHNFNMDKTKLVINNKDTLSINEDGKFLYKIKADKKGLLKLDTKSMIYNPVIEDYYSHFSTWEYMIE